MQDYGGDVGISETDHQLFHTGGQNDSDSSRFLGTSLRISTKQNLPAVLGGMAR